MPRAIAIETSGQEGSIAAVVGDKVGEEVRFPHGLQHAAQIVPIIDRICRGHNWTPRDIQELYISIGPGSFTGLRIAVTLAKTMALATDVKLVAIPSTRVLVHNAPAQAQNAIVVLDAKRGQIFTARFTKHDDQWVETEPAHLDTLAAMLARSPRPVWLVGQGINYHRNAINPADTGVIVTPADSWRARAMVVAELGLAAAGRGEYVDPLTLEPIYIRLPEAEEKWRIEHGIEVQTV